MLCFLSNDCFSASEVTIIKLERPSTEEKISIREPEDMEGDCFEEKELVCVLAHRGSGSGGHWVPYRKVGSNWWCLDSLKNDITKENPFNKQDIQNIEIMFFKE